MFNVTYLCPNCHRMAHSGVINNDELVPLSAQIGDKWKEFYYVKNNKIWVS